MLQCSKTSQNGMKNIAPWNMKLKQTHLSNSKLNVVNNYILLAYDYEAEQNEILLILVLLNETKSFCFNI